MRRLVCEIHERSQGQIMPRVFRDHDVREIVSSMQGNHDMWSELRTTPVRTRPGLSVSKRQASYA